MFSISSHLYHITCFNINICRMASSCVYSYLEACTSLFRLVFLLQTSKAIVTLYKNSAFIVLSELILCVFKKIRNFVNFYSLTHFYV